MSDYGYLSGNNIVPIRRTSISENNRGVEHESCSKYAKNAIPARPTIGPEEPPRALVPSLEAAGRARWPHSKSSTASPTHSTGTLSRRTRRGHTDRIGRVGSPSARSTGSIRFRRTLPMCAAISRSWERSEGAKARSSNRSRRSGTSPRSPPRTGRRDSLSIRSIPSSGGP